MLPIYNQSNVHILIITIVNNNKKISSVIKNILKYNKIIQ